MSFLLAATVGNLAAGDQAHAVPPAAVSAAKRVPARVDGRPDRVSAFLAAAAQRSRVEVTDERTESSTTWANPDGTVTRDESTGPVRVRRGDAWLPVDLHLVRVAGGWAPAASPSAVTFSAGGDGPAVKISEGTKKVWLNWAKTLPTPKIKGAQAIYAVDATTDLVLTALPEGFEQSLVLKKAPATAPKVRLPMDLAGLTMTDDVVGGGYEFRNAAGEAVFSTPKPLMWDAQRDEGGLPSNRRAVAATMVDNAEDAQLDLTPSMGWLTDPSTKYPVTIDPTIASVERFRDTFVASTETAAGVHGGDRSWGIGVTPGGAVMRALVQYQTPAEIRGAHVTSASLKLWNYWALTCIGKPVYAYPVTSGWTNGTISWANQPTVNTTSAYAVSKSFSHGYEAGGCANAYDSLDVTKIAAGWASGVLANNGIELRASETDPLQRKYFCAMNLDTDNPPTSSCTTTDRYPTLSVTYNSYPGAPSKLNLSPSTTGTNGTRYMTSYTPTLSAAVPNADGTKVKLNFEISHNPAFPNDPAVPAWTGSVTGVTAGTTGSIQVPANALTASHYQWRVRGSVVNGVGGTDYGPWSAYQIIATNVARPAAPAISCTNYASGAWTAQITGNETCTLDTASTDGAGYYWSLDDPTPTTGVTGGGGAAATITLTAPAKGQHTLYARAYDTAWNQSPTTTYTFGVGNGGLTTPADDDRTQTAVSLTTESNATRTQLTYYWHTGTTATWTTVPTNDVTPPGSSTPITSWPQAGAASGSQTAYGALNWNVARTAAASADGPIQVRACFNGSTTDCSAPTTITLARSSFADSAASENIGPGTVSLNTGDFQVSRTDANQAGLSVGRTATSLAPAAASAGAEGVFGPGWIASLPGPDIGAGDTILADHATDGYVTVTDSDGSPSFYLTTSAALSSATKFVGIGDADDGSIIRCAAFNQSTPPTCTAWTLTDTDGTVTTWKKTGTGATAAWTVDSIVGAGQDSTTQYTRDGNGRVTRILAPAPTGVSCAALVVGCRALNLTYASTTTATGTTEPTWADYAGRLSAITYTAYDPDTRTMKTTGVARFTYDTTGHLRASWDPRLSTELAQDKPSSRYTYDSAGRIATIATAGRATWTMTYDSTKRLADVSRPNPAGPDGTEIHAVAYGLKLDTPGAPDLRVTQTGAWNQTTDLPFIGAAVFPSSRVPAKDATNGAYAPAAEDWPYAHLTYVDVNGRAVNTASYGAGAWQLDATRYDDAGNAVWELDAGNRGQALIPTTNTDPYVAAQASSATRADLLATVSKYTTDGVDLLGTTGPAHPVVLDSGELSSVRVQTTYAYDQGRPTDLERTGLVTTVVEGPAALDGKTVTAADIRTTKTGYQPIDGTSTTGPTSGWVLHAPTTQTTVMGAGTPDIVTRTRYDASGRTVESRMPASDGTDAGTTITTYYTAAANTALPTCGNKPAWAGAVCQSGPKVQPTGATLPIITNTYGYWGDTDTVTETSGSTTRTTTTGYDEAARPTKSAITVTPAVDGGTAIPATTTTYDSVTGTPTAVTDGTKAITTTFNSLGRVTGYTDADGLSTSVSYDIDGNIVTRNDGKGTYTYTYDGTDSTGKVEHRGLLTALNTGMGTALSTFSGAYDADGRLTSQTYPNALVATTTYDNTGDARSLTYTKTGATWYRDATRTDAHGRTTDHASTASAQDYTYDAAGRLTVVKDTDPWGQCTTRQYTFNPNSTRAALTTAPSASDGSCQIAATPDVTKWTYDDADRLTNAGYSYDNFGRTLTVPSEDLVNGTTAGSISVGYYANDMVASQTQGTHTKSFTLDPKSRLRGAIDTTNGTQTRKITNHYADTGDSPAWITIDDTSSGATASTWQRNVQGLSGSLAALQDSTGSSVLQLTNLHGDVIATADNESTASSTTATFESTEYGAPGDSNVTSPERYSWLGGKQRSTDDLGGLTLMGVRLYNPITGRFLSMDPITGGNANSYTYPVDPVNEFDTTGKSEYSEALNGWNRLCADFWSQARRVRSKLFYKIDHYKRLGIFKLRKGQKGRLKALVDAEISFRAANLGVNYWTEYMETDNGDAVIYYKQLMDKRQYIAQHIAVAVGAGFIRDACWDLFNWARGRIN